MNLRAALLSALLVYLVVASSLKRPHASDTLILSTLKRRKLELAISGETGLSSIPNEAFLRIIELDGYGSYDALKLCSTELRAKILGYDIQYRIIERLLNARNEPSISVGMDMAFMDCLEFAHGQTSGTMARLIASRLSNFGSKNQIVVKLCLPFLINFSEFEREKFTFEFLQNCPIDEIQDVAELVPIILGGADHTVGRIILSHINMDDKVMFEKWERLFESWPEILKMTKLVGSKLMMAMYLGMRGLMATDGGVSSPDFSIRNSDYIRSFASLRQFLSRAPLQISYEGLVKIVLPGGPGADLGPLADLVASFCWVCSPGILHSLDYFRLMHPRNFAECSDLAIPLSILVDRKPFEYGDLSPGQLKFFRLFDHSGREVDQLTMDAHLIHCLAESTGKDTIRFLCTAMYTSSAQHMNALFNTLNAALDFTSPKKLAIFRNENHLLAWSCCVSWIHMEHRLIVYVVLDILEEMYGAAKDDAVLVQEYANVLAQTPEFRSVLIDGMYQVSEKAQKVLSTVYELNRVEAYEDTIK